MSSIYRADIDTVSYRQLPSRTFQYPLSRIQRTLRRKIHRFIFAITLSNHFLFFRPPGPASAGRGGLYILLLHFIFLFFCHLNLWTRIGPSAARRYYKTDVAAGDAHKISTDIRPMVPPFFTGGQNALVGAAKITTPIVFGPSYF